MAVEASNLVVRPLSDTDIEAITRIDEKVGGVYRPEFWEDRVAYYLRRDPEARRVAEIEGKVVGFMLADLRGGEFGLEETSGWIERFGVDPEFRGRGIGRRLFEALGRALSRLGRRRRCARSSTPQADNAQFLAAVGFRAEPL